MAQETRQCYPRLPAGFGSVRYLGAGRKNPYAVHPSLKGWDKRKSSPEMRETSVDRAADVLMKNAEEKREGGQCRPAAICYVRDWFTGVAVLAAWNAGVYQPGMEWKIGSSMGREIHSLIRTLTEEILRQDGEYLKGYTQYGFIRAMSEKMIEIGIDGGERHHTPHSCRHTFSRLCESYGVREADRKRMLGHSFKNDITNGVYGHRTLEELRVEIEKIRMC